MKRLYLAGPDVFFPDANQRAETHKALCRQYGFEPLHPIDQPTLTASHIYTTNIRLLQQADAVLANLNPFRGAEVDSGTAFEVGYAVASGKPVIGYLVNPETLADRVARLFGPLSTQEGISRDCQGNLVETFDHPVNLMLAQSCQIVIGDFEAALQQMSAFFDRLIQ